MSPTPMESIGFEQILLLLIIVSNIFESTKSLKMITAKSLTFAVVKDNLLLFGVYV